MLNKDWRGNNGYVTLWERGGGGHITMMFEEDKMR